MSDLIAASQSRMAADSVPEYGVRNRLGKSEGIYHLLSPLNVT
jgi:hypothetical protein